MNKITYMIVLVGATLAMLSALLAPFFVQAQPASPSPPASGATSGTLSYWFVENSHGGPRIPFVASSPQQAAVKAQAILSGTTAGATGGIGVSDVINVIQQLLSMGVSAPTGGAGTGANATATAGLGSWACSALGGGDLCHVLF